MIILRNTPARMILICCFLAYFTNGFGQEKPSFVSLQGGMSLPLGKYSQKSLDEGCFTLPGLTTGLEGAWFFSPHYGVGASAFINWHPVDVGYLGYEKVIKDPFLEDVYIRSESYRVITGMIGPFCSFQLKNKLHFSGKLLGGLMRAKTPWQLYKPDYFMVQTIWYEITPAIDWNYSFQAGADLTYDITSCYGIVLSNNIFYSKLAFRFNTSTETIVNERVFSFVNTTIGIRFRL